MLNFKSIISVLIISFITCSVAQTNSFKYKHRINGLSLKVANNNTSSENSGLPSSDIFKLSTIFLDFGKISSQSNEPKSVVLTNTSSSPINFQINSNNLLSIVNNCPASIGAYQQCTLSISPVFSLGLKSGAIAVSAAGVSKTMSFSFEGVLADKVETNVSAVDFGTLQEGQTSSKYVFVTNSGESVYSPEITASAGYSVDSACYTVYPQNSCWATVTALGVSANPNGTLTIKGGNFTKQVVLTSNVLPNIAGIDISVGDLSFGALIQGQNSTKSFYVMNTGNTVYAPQLTVSPGYSVVSGCYTLYPQNSCWVSVTALGSVVNQNGVFTVTAGTASKTISLTSTVSPLIDAVDTSVSSLDFGSLIEGQAGQGKSFMVMNTGNTVYAPQIVVSAGFSAVSACYNMYPQNSCWVTVTPLASTTNPTGVLTVTAGTASKTVALVSSVASLRAAVDTSVDNISFGTLMAQSNPQGKSFMVMNTGNTIFTPSFSITPGFTFSHACYNLYPQSTCWVTVNSMASEANPNGSITITGGSASKTVTLTSTVTP